MNINMVTRMWSRIKEVVQLVNPTHRTTLQAPSNSDTIKVEVPAQILNQHVVTISLTKRATGRKRSIDNCHEPAHVKQPMYHTMYRINADIDHEKKAEGGEEDEECEEGEEATPEEEGEGERHEAEEATLEEEEGEEEGEEAEEATLEEGEGGEEGEEAEEATLEEGEGEEGGEEAEEKTLEEGNRKSEKAEESNTDETKGEVGVMAQDENEVGADNVAAKH